MKLSEFLKEDSLVEVVRYSYCGEHSFLGMWKKFSFSVESKVSFRNYNLAYFLSVVLNTDAMRCKLSGLSILSFGKLSFWHK